MLFFLRSYTLIVYAEKPTQKPTILHSKGDDAVKSVQKRNTQKKMQRLGSHVDTDSDSNNDGAVMQAKWPVHACLSGAGLLKENLYICTLCYEAIAIIEKAVVTTYAWPELNHMAAYRHEVLMKALKELQKKDNCYNNICARLKSDPKFEKDMGKYQYFTLTLVFRMDSRLIPGFHTHSMEFPYSFQPFHAHSGHSILILATPCSFHLIPGSKS
jgi:hypothetical protein